MSEWNLKIIEEFRANEGRVGGMFEGAALLLLTTTGARSGRRHTTPLTYLDDGGRLLVFASNAGGPNHPAWYHNVLADPRVTVEVGTASYRATALPLQGGERDRQYARQSELVPAYAEYQRQTTRAIPVVALYDTAHRADRAAAIGDHLVKVHAELLDRLAAIREEAAAFFTGRPSARPAPDLGAQLRTHCFTVCDALGEHHTNEDAVFPRLEKLFPGLSPTLERLRDEHRAVIRTKNALRALLDDVETTDPARFQAELTRMTAELEAHFAYEEEQLVPLLNSVTLAHPES
ncbi:nitroreductase/quinone reductase family protein [Actinocorallia populi]|uniref:nitroreductase/quinone reductase family protein n=1 Tax=Actinocorallia populi TaxID=2079200 RepID=UPI001E3CA5F8|nr:nitroreductase/quinone reductase family protein [Actinocorallia populi]